MTQTRYFLWRTAQAFGISIRRRHATNAATEFHLMREAEEVLGQLAWQDTEDIEDLSVEYWNLRRMSKNHQKISDEIEAANLDLQRSQDQRTELLGLVVDSTKDLVEERRVMEDAGARLRAEHEVIISDARAIRRRHDGIKAKLEVLIAEEPDDTPDIVASKEELLRLKTQFKKLRERRDTVVTEIESFDSSLEAIGSRIETKRSSVRGEARDSYQTLGQANRDLSHNRMELNSLEGQMNIFFAEIGRYILAHYREPALSAIASRHHGLIKQISALGLSIRLNRRLAGENDEPPS